MGAGTIGVRARPAAHCNRRGSHENDPAVREEIDAALAGAP